MICPICEKDRTIPLIVDLLVCNNCNHIFKNEEVDKKAYELYRSSAHMERTPQHIKDANLAANIRMNNILMFKKGGKLLELGSGHKFFLDLAKKNGFDVEGTELSKPMIDEIAHTIHYGNPSEIEALGKYDVICGFHVLEHINKPIEEVRILADCLNEGGIIAFELPTMIFYGMELNANDFYEGVHTQYFNQMSLNIFLKRCRLKPVYMTNYWEGTKTNTYIVAIKESEDIKPFEQSIFKRLAGEKNE